MSKTMTSKTIKIADSDYDIVARLSGAEHRTIKAIISLAVAGYSTSREPEKNKKKGEKK